MNVSWSRIPALTILPLGLAILAHGQGAQVTTLHTFSGRDGLAPVVGVIQASDGNLYGTTSGYGATSGSIYKLSTTGALTTLHTFCLTSGCPDGSEPSAQVIEASDGNLYGVTATGGANPNCPIDGGCGTIFGITPAGAFKTLYTFCPDGSPYSQTSCRDGYAPASALIQGEDGNLYGASNAALFKIDSKGEFSVIVPAAYSSVPQLFGPPLQGTDGNLYFTIADDDNDAYYNVYALSPGGDGTLIGYSELGTVRSLPALGLVETSTGSFYGEIYSAGDDANMEGFLFRVNGGVLTDVHDFCSLSCADGAYPDGQLLLASDGSLYGTDTTGEIYSLSPSGAFNVIASLGTVTSVGGNLIQGSDGNLYGITELGGVDGSGTIFRLTPATALSPPVHLSFSSPVVAPGTPVTASLKVLNAFSLTMQQCYAFATSNGITTPLGKVPGTYNSSTKLYTFSGTLTPTKTGVYNYAVTCGGVESGYATLTVGDPTQTVLTATPNPVTPPASVTLTATVSRTAGSGTPGGEVRFSSGSLVLGSAKLNGSGVATLAASSKGVGPGTYPVTAQYEGDSVDAGSNSAAVDVVVK